MKQGSTGKPKHVDSEGRPKWTDFTDISAEEQLSIIGTYFVMDLIDFVVRKYGKTESVKMFVTGKIAKLDKDENMLISPGKAFVAVQDLLVKYGDASYDDDAGKVDNS